jgi:hypothetical protein
MGINGLSSSRQVQALVAFPEVEDAPPEALAAEENGFEGPAEPAPVDLQGAPQGDWSATAASQDDLWPVSEADPVALQPAARSPLAIDPGKVGVVLNDNPADLPSGQELNDLGVTGARITLSGQNFSPDNAGDWQGRLQDYRDHGIDVMLNLPRELDGSGTFPDPPAKEVVGTDGDGNPVWRVAPSDAQPQEWKDAFDAWKNDAYLPRVQEVLDSVGGYASSLEIWNEPDEQANRVDYSPGLPAGQFGELLRDVYGMVHGPDADPEWPADDGAPRIVTGGLDSGRTDWLDGAMVDGKLYADAVGVHPYTKRPDESYDADEPWNWTGTAADIARDYGRFGKPLDFTEAGDRRGFSDYIPAFAAAASQEGNVDRTYFFWGDPYDGELGLTAGRDDDGQPIYRAGASELQERLQQWNQPTGEAGVE